MIRAAQVTTRHPVVPLGSVVTFLDHIRKPVKESDRLEGPYPYFGANGQQGTIAEYLFDEPLVLLAEDGGYFDEPERGVAYRIEGKSWVNNHAHVLKPTNKVDIAYLARHLEHYDLLPFVNGTTRSKLTKANAERIPLWVPPLPEQRRIATILDKADAIRRNREESIRLNERLLRSTFLEMFGDPATNPNGWEICPFEGLATNQDGRRRPVKEADRAERHGEYPYYGASGIIDYVDEFLFDERTLLIAEDGANLLARSTPIAFVAEGKYWVNNHAHVVSANGKAELDYLRFSLNLRNLDNFVTGSAQPKLNQASLNRIPIPLPPLSSQRKFAKLVRLLNELNERRQTALSEAKNLCDSLVQRAFRGDL